MGITGEIPWLFPDFDSKLQNSLTCNQTPWLFPDSEKDWNFPDFSLTVATQEYVIPTSKLATDSMVAMLENTEPHIKSRFTQAHQLKNDDTMTGTLWKRCHKTERWTESVTHVLQPLGDCLATKKQLQAMQPLCNQKLHFLVADQLATGRRQLSLKIGDWWAIDCQLTGNRLRLVGNLLATGRQQVGDWLSIKQFAVYVQSWIKLW